MNKLFIIIIFVLFYSCKTKVEKDSIPTITVDYKALKLKSINELPNDFFKKTDYVLLSNSNNKSVIGRIDKIICENNKLYILDKAQKSIFVYTDKGIFVNKINNAGRATNEYISISDFDVDNDKIYLIDGITDKAYVYKSNGNFIKSKKLDFEADIITVYKETILLGLSSWNKGKFKGRKILSMDKDFNINQSYLAYDQFTDPSYEISSYRILESQGNLFYNKNIDNNIYIFNKSMNIEKIITIDFGQNNVPDEDKKSIEINIEKYNNNYCLIKDYVLVKDNYIIGKLRYFGKSICFVIDIENNIKYQSIPVELYENNMFTEYSNGKMFSYFISDNTNNSNIILPDSVKTHIHNDGCVVKVQTLW